MSSMTLQAEVAGLKADREKLQVLVNQYAREVLDLERRLLLLQQAPQRPPTSACRMADFMARGHEVRAATLAQELGIPLNTVYVTLRRHPRLFRRVGWGLYTKV